MAANPCIKCQQNHTNPQHFLLTCFRCKRCWHNDCYEPKITTKEVVGRIEGTVRNDPNYNISNWVCARCRKRPAVSTKSASSASSRPSSVKRESTIAPKEGRPIIDVQRSSYPQNEDPGDTSSGSESELVESRKSVPVRVDKQEQRRQDAPSLPTDTGPGDTSSESESESIKRESAGPSRKESRNVKVEQPDFQNRKSARKIPNTKPLEIVTVDDDSDSDIQILPGPPASVPPETPAPSRSVSTALTEPTVVDDDQTDQLINDGLGEDEPQMSPGTGIVSVDSGRVGPEMRHASMPTEPSAVCDQQSHVLPEPSTRDLTPMDTQIPESIPCNSYPFAPTWMHKYLEHETDTLPWQHILHAQTNSRRSSRRKPTAKRLDRNAFNLDLVNTSIGEVLRP
ncbi:hypothetical protein VKT23_003597 [Stygiomarasmius scandens]|uniref:PHD-type domain-containing protein n=1 Tax=Marasmiellus scandens TaxID=2682957 RepID=A0ABR1K0H7_9AGAR